MIGAVLRWKKFFRLQLQFFSPCYVGINCLDLPILASFVFLIFFIFSFFSFCGFPCFFVRFCSLFQGFQGFCREENPCFCGGSSLFLREKKNKDWRVRVLQCNLVSLQNVIGERKKPINRKNFGGTPLGLCPVCPVDMSHMFCHLSHLSFCPLNVNFHINRPKRPGCPWDVPDLSPGRPWGIPTTKLLYVIFLYRFLFSIFVRAALLLGEIWISPPPFLQDPLVSEKLQAMYLFSSMQESFEQTLPSTPKLLQYKKVLRGINFVKITKNIIQSTRLPEERMRVTEKIGGRNEFP